MIEVLYWPRELRMVVRGHAVNGGGRWPLVCAGASTVLYALESTTNGFRKVGWCKRHFHREESGIGYVRIWAKRRYFKRCRVAMGMAYGAMLMLEESFPEAIRCEVCTGMPFDDTAAMDCDGGLTYLRKALYDAGKGRKGRPAESPAERGRKDA